MFKVRQFYPMCTNILRRSHLSRINSFSAEKFSTANKNVDVNDEPIKYSTSPAIKYKAKSTRTGVEVERLWYEPYVISVSIAVFLLYFCVFREENDIDKELNTSLYSRIEGLEESQLKIALKYNEDNGKDTADIKNRLREIEEEKRKKNISDV